MKPLLASTCMFFFLFFLSLAHAHAQNPNFTLSAQTTFSVLEDGTTHGVYYIQIANKTDYAYASSFSISLGSTNPKNIQVYNAEGEIPFRIKKEDDKRTVEVTFNRRVAGIGEVNSFYVTFDSLEIAKRRGVLWEITIPGVSNIEDFATYDTRIKTPSVWGLPTSVKPHKEFLDISQEYSFSKEETRGVGIELVFGKAQVYEFHLQYHLENTNAYPVKTEIALPPSTSYQDIIIERVAPAPFDTYEDQDGNWLALFALTAHSNKTISVEGFARVYATPKQGILSSAKKSTYLSSSQFWQVDDPAIQRVASDLKTPEKIYRYVVATLSYSYEKAAGDNVRLGAKKALATPHSAVCLEFTDLFVTLARAAGIPARSLEGYAHTENSKLRPLSFVKDILHTWPEYYNAKRNAWVAVDPTWEDTTGGIDYFTHFDFDHLAFVVKGKDSTYPIPAGGYKTTLDSKDISVSFANDSEFVPRKNAQLTLNIPSRALPGLPLQGSVAIHNTGNTPIYNTQLTISSPLESTSPILLTHTIPPFGKKTVPLILKPTSLLTNGSFPITISLDRNHVSKTVTITFFDTKVLLGGGVFLGTLIIFYIARKTRSIPFQRQEG